MDPRMRQRGRGPESLKDRLMSSPRTQETLARWSAAESRATTEHVAAHPATLTQAQEDLIRRGFPRTNGTLSAKREAALEAIARSKEPPAQAAAGRPVSRPMTDEEVVEAIARKLAGAGRGAIRDAERAVTELLEAIQFAARSGTALDVSELSPAAAKLSKLSSAQLAQYAQGVEQGWAECEAMDEVEAEIEATKSRMAATGLDAISLMRQDHAASLAAADDYDDEAA